jgi:mono/diheme cytochrome c family protein
MRSRFTLVGFLLATSLLCFAFAGDGRWLQHVPDADRARTNPYAANPDAQAAGAKLFNRYCAECHGENGQGKGGHPALLSARVRHASDGELQWLLRNGSLRNGMPSWSSLPMEQRWQIIAHVRTLQQSAQVAALSAN